MGGLNKIYPQNVWNETLVSFHRSSMMWESLSVIASFVGKESSFHEELQSYLNRFEGFLQKAWEDNAQYWSFSSARALSIRWHSKGLKKKKRTAIKKWAKEHVDRFLGRPSKKASGLDGSDTEKMAEGILK